MRFFIVVSFLLGNSLFSQIQKMITFENRIENKIIVGMSPNEVKKILGNPMSVEGGFPDSENSVIEFLPGMAGQINNSTWFYFYKNNIINVKDTIPAGFQYIINGVDVSEAIYEQYLPLINIYYYNGYIISTGEAKGYSVLRDPKLITQIKDTTHTYKKKTVPIVKIKSYLPIFCVIFDKGTQVVAGRKTFFQLLGE